VDDLTGSQSHELGTGGISSNRIIRKHYFAEATWDSV